jgi:hypothetical protein
MTKKIAKKTANYICIILIAVLIITALKVYVQEIRQEKRAIKAVHYLLHSIENETQIDSGE